MESEKPLQPKSADSIGAAVTPAPTQETKAARTAPPKTSKSALEVKKELEAANPRERGFDPYNSGSFNIKDTWSRVDRKK